MIHKITCFSAAPAHVTRSPAHLTPAPGRSTPTPRQASVAGSQKRRLPQQNRLLAQGDRTFSLADLTRTPGKSDRAPSRATRRDLGQAGMGEGQRLAERTHACVLVNQGPSQQIESSPPGRGPALSRPTDSWCRSTAPCGDAKWAGSQGRRNGPGWLASNPSFLTIAPRVLQQTCPGRSLQHRRQPKPLFRRSVRSLQAEDRRVGQTGRFPRRSWP